MTIPLIPAHRISFSDVVPATTPATDAQGVQQVQEQNYRPVADRIASEWNAVHGAIGSFADEHSTL